MATDTIESLPATPLTVLSEEEQMFQQSVREFAIERVRPLVHDMDREATMSKELIANFFAYGPNVSFKARVSATSPSGVLVPWALI